MGGISTRNFKMFRREHPEERGDRDEHVGRSQPGGQLRASAQRILRHLLYNQPLPLLIQSELVDQRKNISQTVAGAELNRELLAQAEKHRQEMMALRDEMTRAVNEQDEQTRQELEVELNGLAEELRCVREESQNLVSNYDAEKARFEGQIRAMNEAIIEENKRAEAAYLWHLRELEKRLYEASLRSAETIQELDGWIIDARTPTNTSNPSLQYCAYYLNFGAHI
ncbi:hypothetical protein H0H81_006984 [Sphagnurus paluster]|uniref:Uncharacterized protein n=1 Tax=Sphagnurus paluster TaxID=117069 RepID=A0A9P7GNS2_9AGAR|nr:hypothetical protein H0H81_006984 [Sphagnurus paluster]